MWLLAPFLAFAVALAAHAMICRLPVKANALIKFVAVGGLLGLLLGAILLRQYGLSIFTISGLLLYAGLCELYIFLFNSVLTSISANLLAYLAERDLSDVEIDQLYDSRTMVQRRVDRLRANGLAEVGPQGLRATPKGLRLMASLSAMRRLFRHEN